MKPLTVGMIGLGGFGGYRRNTMRQSGLFKIAAVYDRNPQTLTTVAAEEQARACASFDEVLNTPGVEGIVISTGADSHAPLGVQAMKAGLHVFIEKPLCATAEELKQLRDCQRQTGRVAGTGHGHMPSDPLAALFTRYIADGKLGVVASYEMNSSHSGGLEIKPGDWRGLADKNPGGMLFQCGVHALHELNYLFGPVVAVQAMMRYDANPNTQTADVANVLLRHSSGMVGTLNCYHVTAYCHEVRIFGTVGNLYADTQQKRAWFQPRKRGDPEERVPVEVGAAEPSHLFANVANWVRAIRENQPMYPSLDDGANAVLPVFAAEIAAKERREVSVAELAK